MIAIERFGCVAGEIGIGEKAPHEVEIRAPGQGQCPVAINRNAGVFERPIVQQGVAGTCVKREQRLYRVTDPGYIGDAADVEDGKRTRQIMGQRAMVDRDQRRTLAARGDVIAAEISDDFDTAALGQPVAIADLPSPAALGAMQDRMPVEPDQIDLAAFGVLSIPSRDVPLIKPIVFRIIRQPFASGPRPC